MPASASQLLQHYRRLIRQRAFADSNEQRRSAVADLASLGDLIGTLPAREARQLDDSGLPGTTIFYRFSWDVAKWLARSAPGQVTIDWPEIEDEAAVDNLLRHLLLPADDEYFDSGWCSAKDWLQLAKGDSPGTDFDWLMSQLRAAGPDSVAREKYDAADLPLAWHLGRSRFALPHNAMTLVADESGAMTLSSSAKNEIRRPVDSIRHATSREGRRLVDVAVASLATRHRETNHFNGANANDVHVANVGAGLSVVIFGLRPAVRYPLECTVGHLVLAHGVPVGYGGASAVFGQVNTGVNVFEEFRGHGAAFIWVQVMRVLHTLLGCRRYIANPYQLGADNTEALRSGAFWFYYKLGYRPVDKAVRALARSELARRRRNPDYRCSISTLKALTACDMHLTLPGTRASDYFDEEWLQTSSMLATRIVADAPGRTRAEALQAITERVCRDLDIRSYARWSANERNGLRALAPFVAAAHPDNWTLAEKRETRDAVRHKGGASEIPYAQKLATNQRFLQDLRRACMRVG